MIRRAARRTAIFAVSLFLVGCVWELYKAIGPSGFGSWGGLLPSTTDNAMPHAWDIVQRLGEPETRASTDPMWITVLGYVWQSGKLALGGLLAGTVIGVGLAVLMARFRIAERALLPWIIMSQTVPLIALSPQVKGWTGKLEIGGWEWPGWASICLLAAFLAFFPIAVGTLRGLNSAPAASLELMDSYAASWTRTLFKVRFPAAVPHMVPALKLAGSLSVVGVIVAELSVGGAIGIGRATLSYLQTGAADPVKLYGGVLGAALLGLAMYALVVVFDVIVMRNRPKETTP